MLRWNVTSNSPKAKDGRKVDALENNDIRTDIKEDTENKNSIDEFDEFNQMVEMLEKQRGPNEQNGADIKIRKEECNNELDQARKEEKQTEDIVDKKVEYNQAQKPDIKEDTKKEKNIDKFEEFNQMLNMLEKQVGLDEQNDADIIFGKEAYSNELEQTIEPKNLTEDIVDGPNHWPDTLQNTKYEEVEYNQTQKPENDKENRNVIISNDTLNRNNEINNDNSEENIVGNEKMIDMDLDEILANINGKIKAVQDEIKKPSSITTQNTDIGTAETPTDNQVKSDTNLDEIFESLNSSSYADPEEKPDTIQRDRKNLERKNSVNVTTDGLGSCAKCGKPLQDSAIMVGGDYFHKECFTCYKCGVSLDGKFYPVNGENYCEKDWLDGLEKCSECGKPMQLGIVSVNDKKFHPECFVCVICRNKLDGTFFNTPDGPVCEKDYKQTREKCYHCGLPMMERIVSAANNKYHPTCFRCAVCDKILDGKPFLVDGTSITCSDCYSRLKARQCYGCGKGIISSEEKKTTLITVNGHTYHKECCNCKDCGKNLSGQSAYTAGDEILCFDDYMRR